MFTFNGIDYKLHLLGALIVALFFMVQYVLCGKAKRIWIKLIPAYGVVLLIIFAVLVAVSGHGDMFRDLQRALALLIFMFALVCGAAAGAAWALYRARHKK